MRMTEIVSARMKANENATLDSQDSRQRARAIFRQNAMIDVDSKFGREPRPAPRGIAMAWAKLAWKANTADRERQRAIKDLAVGSSALSAVREIVERATV